MLDDSEETLAYVTRIRADHKRIRESLKLIEQQLTQGPRLAEIVKISDVLAGLKKLKEDLAHHFMEEESGGCLEEAVSHQASLSHSLTLLEQEHPKLLKQIDRLIEWLDSHATHGDSMEKIKPDFLNFARELHSHEAKENSILEKSFGVEMD